MNAVSDIFKAYDVRGKVGSELTAEVANDIGKAFADYLPTTGAVAVGRDMRPDSAELAAALIQGLSIQGRNVVDIGEVTSDMIYFAVGSLKLAGGTMVTASHNPGEYNGIKLCREEARPVGLESGLDQIRDNVLTKSFQPAATKSGSLTEQSVTEDWIRHVLTFIDDSKQVPLKLAVDAGNGMAGKIFPELEPYVPWEINEMYFELDGTFPNHEANPLKFETMVDLIKVVKDNKLDGGVAFDGDGDRALLVDETGTVIDGNVMNAVMAEHFLAEHPGSTILYDLRSSKVIPETIVANGGKAVRTPVGHANIKRLMRNHDSPFGGELSGHFYFRDNWFADSGLIGSVIVLHIAGLSGKPLSELRKQYTKYATIAETNFEVDNKNAMLERIATAFPGTKVDRLDGVTIDFNNGSWLNFRPSNTEPLLRLNAEAKTQSELNQLVSKTTKLIQGDA